MPSRFHFNQPLQILLTLFLLMGMSKAAAESEPFISPLDFLSSWKTSQSLPQSQVLKHFLEPQVVPPHDFKRLYVSDAKELIRAVEEANKIGGKVAIYLNDGSYLLPKTLFIKADHVWLLSSSSDPYRTIIKGQGLKASANVHNIITVASNHFVVDGLTLTNSPNHLIQIAAERGANYPTVRNSILQNSYEQMIKVSYDQHKRPEKLSVGGIIENCVFQYTAGLAPHYYTGGIDALGAVDWRVEDNVFRDIASPAKHIAQHAVHFWVNSANNQVLNNIFIDNDRAIGFGMVQSKRNTSTLKYSNNGGLIQGNVIFHGNNDDKFGDTGIVLEASANTEVARNVIFMQHSYPRAIEYRFGQTQHVLVAENLTNKAIASRNGGQAKRLNNQTKLRFDDFVEHLAIAKKRLQIQALYQPLEPSVKP